MPLLTTNQRGLDTGACVCVLTDLERKLLMMLYKNKQEFVPYQKKKSFPTETTNKIEGIEYTEERRHDGMCMVDIDNRLNMI